MLFTQQVTFAPVSTRASTFTPFTETGQRATILFTSLPLSPITPTPAGTTRAIPCTTRLYDWASSSPLTWITSYSKSLSPQSTPIPLPSLLPSGWTDTADTRPRVCGSRAPRYSSLDEGFFLAGHSKERWPTSPQWWHLPQNPFFSFFSSFFSPSLLRPPSPDLPPVRP